MSMPTLAAGDHDDWDDTAAFAEIVEHYDDKPMRRPSRSCAEREAIAESSGIRRHRTHEKEV